MFEHWGDVTGEPGGIDYIEVDAGGVPALWAKPKDADQSRVLLCTHGGGYMVGSPYSHRKMFGHIAKAVGAIALIVDYLRAPEHVHPAQVEDSTDAYAWLLDQGFKPEHIALTGDSAGGGLAITVALNARKRGLPLPAASLPISPWTDMLITGETITTHEAKDHFVKRSVVEHMSANFLGENGDRFAEAVKAAGGEVKIDIYPQMQHVFHFLAGTAPEADQAIKDQAA